MDIAQQIVQEADILGSATGNADVPQRPQILPDVEGSFPASEDRALLCKAMLAGRGTWPGMNNLLQKRDVLANIAEA